MVIAPARRAGDPGSNPGPGKNFSLKLVIYDSSDGHSRCSPPSWIDGTSASRRVMGI